MNEEWEGLKGGKIVEAVQAKSKTGSRGKRGMGTVLVE